MKRLFLFAAFAAITSGALAQDKSYGPEAFLKKNPTVKRVHWKGTGDQIVIQLKSGEKVTYNLADAKQKAAAEARWGRLPVAPPPPPMVVKTKIAAPPEPPVPAKEDEVAPPPPPPVPAIKGDEVAPPPPPAPLAPPPPPKVKKKGQRVYS